VRAPSSARALRPSQERTGVKDITTLVPSDIERGFFEWRPTDEATVEADSLWNTLPTDAWQPTLQWLWGG
jgi:hypothetical protein